MTNKIHYPEEAYTHPKQFLERNFPNEVPGEEVNILKQVIDLSDGAKITAYAYGDHIFIEHHTLDMYYSYNNNTKYWYMNQHNYRDIQVIDVTEPFVTAEVIGDAYTKIGKDTRQRQRNSFWGGMEDYFVEDVVISYVIGYTGDYHSRTNIYEPYRYLNVRFTTNTGETQDVEIPFTRPKHGHIDLSKSTNTLLHVDLNFHGLPIEWKEDVSDWGKFWEALRSFTFDNYNEAWNLWLSGQLPKEINTKSISSIEKKKNIAPNLEKLKQEKEHLFNFYQWLHDGKIQGGVSNNQLLAAWLKNSGEDYNKLVQSLESVLSTVHLNVPDEEYQRYPETKAICLMFDEAKEKDRKSREDKEWYLRKSNGDKADGLGCPADKYPLTHAAISEGNLPLSVFHDPNDKLKAVNTEWTLWEKAFQREGWQDILCNIAQNASRRTTYEKDITQYISFLFKVEKYLDRNAPRPKQGRKKVGWKAMPKYVESQWSLEMEEADDNGTVKRRSALTPIPDNEKGIIEVPYAAIAIYGRQTTYCYSQYYVLFEEETLDYETNTPVVQELEEKLNGRDDYGLMYYTLTGSPTNRGYPTFLTIFERRKDYTHVHFHRVHPNKYKDGRPVPACKLIEECYRYMAGNVRAEEIYAQQGDMIFIRCEEPKKWDEAEMKGIVDFESHAFNVPNGKPPVMLLENKSKSIKNRLGHILAKDEFTLAHPEHEDLTNMPSGWYEVRRCKSWEANPTAVWSYTID